MPLALVTYPEVATVSLSAAGSAELPRPDDARCLRDAKTGASRGRTDRVGRALIIVRRIARGAVQGGPALPGSFESRTSV